MLVDGEWINDEEWLTQRLEVVHNTLTEIKNAIESGDIDQIDAYKFRKYMDYYSGDKTPSEFWNSSSAQC